MPGVLDQNNRTRRIQDIYIRPAAPKKSVPLTGFESFIVKSHTLLRWMCGTLVLGCIVVLSFVLLYLVLRLAHKAIVLINQSI